MALIVPSWIGAATTSVRTDRAAIEALFITDGDATSNREGLIPGPGIGANGGGGPAQITAGSGQVTISPFRALVQGDYTLSGIPQGMYVCTNIGSLVLATPRSSTTTFRRDRIVVEILDSMYSGSSNLGQVRAVPGTAAASAAAAGLPALPASCLEIGQILVNSDNSIVVTDTRMYTGTNGGITPMSGYELATITDAGAVNTPFVGKRGLSDGQYRDHPNYGLQRWSAAVGRWDAVAGGYVGAFASAAIIGPGNSFGFEAARFTAAYAGQRFQAIAQVNAIFQTANVQQTVQFGTNNANLGQGYAVGQSSFEHVERTGDSAGPEWRLLTRVFDFTATAAGVVIINLAVSTGTGGSNVQISNPRVWIQTASALL